MFTSDIIGINGEIRVNGLTDPSFQILSSRRFDVGRVIMVFDKRVAENTTFRGATEERRYPQVEEQYLDAAVAIIAHESEIEIARDKVKNSGIPGVSSDEWENHAYQPEHVGGLMLSEE